ncbi:MULTISPECIES: hypothetical protein [Streptomyces]|nr:hypothetical protein [Streptomyces sp. NEAU-HV9]
MAAWRCLWRRGGRRGHRSGVAAMGATHIDETNKCLTLRAKR